MAYGVLSEGRPHARPFQLAQYLRGVRYSRSVIERERHRLGLKAGTLDHIGAGKALISRIDAQAGLGLDREPPTSTLWEPRYTQDLPLADEIYVIGELDIAQRFHCHGSIKAVTMEKFPNRRVFRSQNP